MPMCLTGCFLLPLKSISLCIISIVVNFNYFFSLNKLKFLSMEVSQKYIVLDNNPNLRNKSKDLDVNNISPSDQEKIDFMVDYIDACYDGEEDKYGITSGIAIASNQVDLDKKVIYLHFYFDEHEYKYLLANPEIIKHSSQISYLSSGEGCLSVPDSHEGYVPRYSKIIVKGFDLINKEEVEVNAHGLLSICFQHEIDHLSGVLYYDHINKIDPFYVNNE